jgi:hypothetical protein
VREFNFPNNLQVIYLKAAISFLKSKPDDLIGFYQQKKAIFTV